MYIVGNRAFKRFDDALKYCNENDFSINLIQFEVEKIEVKTDKTKNQYQYNYSEIKDAINKVKKFAVTTYKKAEHKTKLYQIKALSESLMYINKYLFDPQFTYEFKEYKIAIDIYYNTTSKKQLDNYLKRYKRYLLEQLNNILRLAA